jgi:hypothetical protein
MTEASPAERVEQARAVLYAAYAEVAARSRADGEMLQRLAQELSDAHAAAE